MIMNITIITADNSHTLSKTSLHRNTRSSSNFTNLYRLTLGIAKCDVQTVSVLRII